MWIRWCANAKISLRLSLRERLSVRANKAKTAARQLLKSWVWTDNGSRGLTINVLRGNGRKDLKKEKLSWIWALLFHEMLQISRYFFFYIRKTADNFQRCFFFYIIDISSTRLAFLLKNVAAHIWEFGIIIYLFKSLQETILKRNKSWCCWN